MMGSGSSQNRMTFLVKQSDGHMVLPGRNSIPFLWCNKLEVLGAIAGTFLGNEMESICSQNRPSAIPRDVDLNPSGKGGYLTQPPISFPNAPTSTLVRERVT